MDEIWLFLDDSPERAALMFQRMKQEDRNKTIWTRTAVEAIEVLTNYKERLERVFLDDTLAGDALQHVGSEESGMEVVRFLEKQKSAEYNCTFVVHGWTEVANKMSLRLAEAGYKVEFKSFGL